jgi:hypothetical protein
MPDDTTPTPAAGDLTDLAPREPLAYAWLIPHRLAVAERPGGGGRSHRRDRRAAEIAWWTAQGVTAVVSGMRSRHALDVYAAAGWQVRWHPLREPAQAVRELPRLLAAVDELLTDPGTGAVLAHCDRPWEMLGAVDAALRVHLGLADDRHQAFEAARRDGLPVGSLASSLVGQAVPVAA